MEKEKKSVNSNLGILLICLFSSIFVMADCLIIDNTLHKYISYKKCSCDSCSGNTSGDNNGEVNENRPLLQTKLSDIVKNDLYILGGKTNLSELTNREKLFHLYRSSLGFDSTKSFGGAIITSEFNNSSLSNLGLELDDIYYYASNCVLYKYDSASDSYNEADDCGFSANYVNSAYVDVSDYSVSNGKYTVSAKYLWYYDEPRDSFYLYGKYSDVASLDYNANEANDKSLVKEAIDIDNFTDEEMMKKIMNDNNVETYNFVFEKVNDNFKLVDFYVS